MGETVKRVNGSETCGPESFWNSLRTGFPRCTLNGLGDMKNASRRKVNTSSKTEKTSAS